MTRCVIFNADDFGASAGINRGVAEAHTRGVLTSASLLVTGRAAGEAARMARDLPDLAVGLHFDVWGEDEREFDTRDTAAARAELQRQLARFGELVGRMPTHVDSHKHAHLQHALPALFHEVVHPLGVPVRGDGRVHYIGGFYAQWEWQVTELRYVSVPFLQQLLRTECAAPWNEIACHPGYPSPDFHSVYLAERAAELQTLTDPRVRATIEELGLRLASYADWRAAAPRARPRSPTP